MKIKLMQNVRVPMPAGTILELEDSQAALLISIGHATPIKDAEAPKAPAKKTIRKG